MIELKKARLCDIESMQNLVKDEVESGVLLPRSDEEIATNIRSYTLAFRDGELAGFASLKIFNANLAEVRSLVVSPNFRKQGIGAKIVEELIKEAEFYGLKQVFALTYQKGFFEKLGFKEISKEELPAQKIWADCIKCKKFPVCNEIAVIYTL
ncbi:MAG: N-acetyltransferase [Campylobacter sp.]|uniref:N-acetyltransferase n=1 Tax=unclassified Campylobacter TaxID=2593542 RepID=UPI001B4A28AE|nr:MULTISPECIES: N-acetyltransferase [unclassified Campylobacter]MBP3207076.1 N-acetyltransferase [Campylobacter sp.]MBP5778865.1 N-acetyltransferase [Campylobacter sp.]MBQ7271340.1 N-acetyltransferase [Campylobacter sp.]MBR0071940.1 N-acetyltransferase [Campylobacter sp.]MBR4140779.1 N-acetyltransferase [Campylobacter sp.]